MTNNRPFGYSIFCEDVRLEIGNKLTMVGCVTGSLTLYGSFPMMLPKFCILTNYGVPEALPPIDAIIRVEASWAEKPLSEIPVKLASGRTYTNPAIELIPEDERYYMTTMPLIYTPFFIPREGRIKVRAYRGDEITRMGSLSLSAQPPPEPSNDVSPPVTLSPSQ